MTLPTRTVQFDPASTWTEDWTGTPSMYLRGHNSTSVGGVPGEVLADDGLMGSRFLRLSNYDGVNIPTNADAYKTYITPAWFDQTVPTTIRYRMRVTRPIGKDGSIYGLDYQDGVLWNPLGILYPGEGIYDGVCLYGTPAFNGGNGGAFRFGMYQRQFQVDDPSDWTPNAGVKDIHIEWWPHGAPDDYTNVLPPNGPNYEGVPCLRAKYSNDGGATWSVWRRNPYYGWRVNTTAGWYQAANAMLTWPFTLYFGMWGWNTVDLGTITITGKPLWGAGDFMGWSEEWETSSIGAGGADGSRAIGGLTGAAKGPIVQPPLGYRIKGVTFVRNEGNTIVVRDGRDESVLADVTSAPQVVAKALTSGATGLANTATTTIPGSPTYYADLDLVAGQPAYIDITGSGTVGGAWFSFEADPDFVSEATYPSPTEWECFIPVSEAPGTFEAVASTGETASVDVPPPFVLRTVEADAAVMERHVATLASDAVVGLRYFITRNASLGRSFAAGPMEPVDSFLQPVRKSPLAADAAVRQRVLRPLLASAVVAERMRPVVAASAAVRFTSSQATPVSAAVQTSATRVAFVSAVVSSIETKSTPASAAVLNTGVVTEAAADAAVAERMLAPVSADAAVMEVGSRACLASAYVALPSLMVAQVTADAAVAAFDNRRTVTADAYVPLAGTVLRQVGASAAVRGSFAPSVAASAFVQIEGYGQNIAQVTADAAVQTTLARSANADALVAEVGTVSKALPASAAVRDTVTAPVAADAAVRFTTGNTIYAEAVVLGSPARVVNADAAVYEAGITRAVAVSAAVRLRFVPGVFADAVVVGGVQAFVSADAAVSWTADRSLPVSAFVIERVAQVVNADALVAEPVRLLVPVDADAFVASAARVAADAFVVDPRAGRGGGSKRANIRSGRGGVIIRRGRERGEI